MLHVAVGLGVWLALSIVAGVGFGKWVQRSRRETERKRHGRKPTTERGMFV